MLVFTLTLLVWLSVSEAFLVQRTTTPSFLPLLQATASKKGFSKQQLPDANENRKKSEGQLKREKEASKYDEIVSQAGQEYTVFIRQFGSDDQSWLPCGSVAVPRGAQVSDAIYANEEALKSSITRMYPKLKGYETEFEFGYNLKVYPDDPIEVAVKGTIRKPGLSVGNWISNLLSPIDTSNVNNNNS